MTPSLFCGMMSGSSLDGIDLAICSFPSVHQYEFIKTASIPLPLSFKEDILKMKEVDILRYTELELAFSQYVGENIRKFAGDLYGQIKLSVCHGHTLFHYPDQRISIQMGDGATIAHYSGINTLVDLRSQDILNGGEGAPLASTADHYLFSDYDFLINLGGIANISVNKKTDQTLAWDIGPCNQMLNAITKKYYDTPYDDLGLLARSGTLKIELLDLWSKIEYFRLDPPKSLDNTWVENHFMDNLDQLSFKPADMLHSFCHFIAQRLVDDCKKMQITQQHGLITGGGAYNLFLVELLQDYSKVLDLTIEIADQSLIEFKEALLMAFMGYLYVQDLPNVLGSATGARRDTIAGALYRANG